MLNKLKSLFTSPSLIVIIAIVLFVLGVHNNLSKWTSKAIIQWDAISYYSYLPATFIEKDLKLSFISDSTEAYYVNSNQYWPTKADNGNRVIKTSMGMAVLYSPFFFIAHALAPANEATGFSSIYHLALLLSGVFYLFIGLFYLRKTLLLFYSEKITSITLVAIYFATNLLYYSILGSAMSHEYNFCLFSILIYFSIQWHRDQKLKYILIIALSFGLLVLVRPVNILLILVFVLYNIKGIASLKERIVFLLKNTKHLLLFALIGFLMFLPQLFYWKYVTGSYFFNSYVGERFYFTQPHLIDCLVGFRKGWLIYTPVMLFALIGIYYLRKTKSPFSLSIIVLLPLYFYVVSSWWCWWYGGSFGLRPMIDLYPLLAFALAAFFSSILYQKKISSKITGVLMGIFIALNLFQTMQSHYNIIHFDSMTMKAYFNSFGKTSKADCDRTLLKSPDYAKAIKGEE